MSYFEIYMISMKHHPISEMYKREVLPSWKEYEVKQFEAVTPKDLYKKTKIDFGFKTAGRKREFTSTEKAVWYSHFELWCECVKIKKPILILEHDSKLVKPLPDMSKEGYKFLSFISFSMTLIPISELPPKINTFFIYLKYSEFVLPIKVPSTSHTLQGMNFLFLLKRFFLIFIDLSLNQMSRNFSFFKLPKIIFLPQS